MRFVEMINGLILDEAAKNDLPPLHLSGPGGGSPVHGALWFWATTWGSTNSAHLDEPMIRGDQKRPAAPRGQIPYTVLPLLSRLRACATQCTTLHFCGLLNRHLYPITLF